MDLFDLFGQVIDNRFYSTLKQEALDTKNDEMYRLVEGVQTVANKHDMGFKELMDILMELSLFLQIKE